MSPSIMPPAAFLQEQSLWCWAAVAEIVLRCMDITDSTRDPECFHNQCVLAHFMFNDLDLEPGAAGNKCCPVLNKEDGCPYNEGAKINKIIELYQQFGLSCTVTNAPLDFEDIQNEIDAGRPVQVLFKYDSVYGEEDEGHVAIIYGYDQDEEGNEYLIVNDPLHGWDWGHVDYEDLKSFYGQYGGEWKATISFS